MKLPMVTCFLYRRSLPCSRTEAIVDTCQDIGSASNGVCHVVAVVYRTVHYHYFSFDIQDLL